MLYAEGQMKVHELYCLWWIAKASHETDETKKNEAMQTAKQHIHIVDDCVEYINAHYKKEE